MVVLPANILILLSVYAKARGLLSFFRDGSVHGCSFQPGHPSPAGRQTVLVLVVAVFLLQQARLRPKPGVEYRGGGAHGALPLRQNSRCF